jgi:hypothetical protein
MTPDGLVEWIGCAIAASMILLEVGVITSMIRGGRKANRQGSNRP